MRYLAVILVMLLSVQTFAEDHREGGGRGQDRGRDRGNDRGRERGHDRGGDGGDIGGILAISDSLLLTSISFENNNQAKQVINDAEDFIQNGNISVLLNINLVQQAESTLSVEDALDLIVDAATATL